MAGNHLENLIKEWFEYRGYFVRTNVQVEKRARGGYDAELDIVAFDPKSGKVVHLEPSLDALSWEKREARFRRKFDAGRKHIHRLLAGLPLSGELDQVAVLVFAATAGRESIGGGRIMHASELLAEILLDLRSKRLAKQAVPEHWPLLRTLQYVCEYPTAITAASRTT